LKQDGIRWNTVAFGQHDDVAWNHLTPNDPLLLAVTDDQRPWTRQIS
jgi:hypothetical protein